MKQLLGRDFESLEQPKQGAEANLAFAALDPRDLDDGEARLSRELFLGPLAFSARRGARWPRSF